MMKSNLTKQTETFERYVGERCARSRKMKIARTVRPQKNFSPLLHFAKATLLLSHSPASVGAGLASMK
jgi:uncharacterized protein (DUF2062 family)